MRRYAVGGALHAAGRLIDAMAHVTPIDARTFEAGDVAAAWAFVDADPAA